MPFKPTADEHSVLEELESVIGGARSSGEADAGKGQCSTQPNRRRKDAHSSPEEDWERSLEAALTQLQGASVAQQELSSGEAQDPRGQSNPSKVTESQPESIDDRVDAELEAALSQFVSEMGTEQQAQVVDSQDATGAEPAGEPGVDVANAEVESLLSNLVQTILSKDVLYAPMLEIRGLYEYQLNKQEPHSEADGESSLSEANRKRYEAQYSCVNEIISCLEDDSLTPSNQTERLMDLIARMENMGDPPPGVLETMNHAKERESQGRSADPSATNAASPEQMMALLEALMREAGDASDDSTGQEELQRVLREASSSANDCRLQ
jgi:hypothetical protein